MGIGSLPICDPKKALDLICEHLPFFPHWPQQPPLGEGARLIPQFTSPLQKLGLIRGEKEKYFFVNHDPDWEKKLTDFYQLYLDIEAGGIELLHEYFALPRDFFPGFYLFLEEERETIRAVKGQVSGPLSVGLQVKDANGRDSFYDTDLRDVIKKTISLEAEWQIVELNSFKLPVLISIDDPGIYACGSSAYISISREDVLTTLRFLSEEIQKESAHVGLHSCTGIDWSLPLESNLQVVSFDAYNYFHTMIGYIEEMNSFLEAGGILAWGLVPTNEMAYQETAKSLLERLRENQDTLIRRGIHRSALLERILFTPSCGCGTLDLQLAERVYSLTRELVELYKRNQ